MSVVGGRALGFAGRVRRGVVRRWRKAMARRPGPRLPDRGTGGIPDLLLAEKRKRLAKRRTFGPSDLERLARLIESADEVVPVREAFARRDDRPPRLITVRHDMDHDVENSVRMARWEAQRGIRSTYYVLHGDWYWGAPGTVGPSKFVLRALDKIASLGHEIGLHNNAITLALRSGDDPGRILDRDLAALRSRGFDVTGSVAHGDPLCHELGYVNNEIFVECPHPSFGAADRVIGYVDPTTQIGRRVALRPRPMAEYGLRYEANFIGHTRYLSDTGGRWGIPFDDLEDEFGAKGGYLQMLVHPAWWAFSGEVVIPRPTIAPNAES